jgi:hypothetical protein
LAVGDVTEETVGGAEAGVNVHVAPAVSPAYSFDDPSRKAPESIETQYCVPLVKSVGLMVTWVPEIVTAAAVASNTCATLPPTDDPVQLEVLVQSRMYLPDCVETFSEKVIPRFVERDAVVEPDEGE